MKRSRKFIARFSLGLALVSLLFLVTGGTTVQKYSLMIKALGTNPSRK
jgi:hypothetical protein